MENQDPQAIRSRTETSVSRRAALAGVVGFSALSAARAAGVDPEFKVSKGRIRQSVMGWCFDSLSTKQLAEACRDIGIVAMEGIGADDYPMVKGLGLEISMVGSHGFRNGPVDRANFGECQRKLEEAIDLAAEVGARNVITFTGIPSGPVDFEEGTKNCVALWKRVVGRAESKGVTLVLEHLNSRDDSHPMKGHPGYFGDDVDHCAQMVREVGSPRFKLLFDVYHVQIMNGDVIRRIRQYRDLIGHYHTAGNPGRGELDETQEINYPAVMREIAMTDFDGYVAQEFIPTWDDPIAALRHAASVCDV